MLQIKQLDHIVIRTRHSEAMIAFYCDVLGCVIERQTAPELGLVQLRAGASLIDIVAVDSQIGRMGGAAPGKEGHNMDHFCLRLEPFDEAAIRQHLRQHGVEGGKLEMRYGAEGVGPSIYIQDPDDNTVELKGPPQKMRKIQ
jgi:catechol 2,3-dioxygenase-like lactoylglutathione lyase family enzyme